MLKVRLVNVDLSLSLFFDFLKLVLIRLAISHLFFKKFFMFLFLLQNQLFFFLLKFNLNLLDSLIILLSHILQDSLLGVKFAETGFKGVF